MAPSKSSRRLNERGVVLLWTAMFLTVMIGFVALGIDVAKLTTTKTQLQNAADAAALAGASAIDPLDGSLMPDTAITRAQFTAAQNRAYVGEPRPVELLASDVTFPRADEIRVTVRRDPSSGGAVVTHIARVLGIKGLELRASAVARIAPSDQVFRGLIPLWAAPPDGETRFETGCGRTYTLKEGGGDGSKGNYGGLTFPQCAGGPCAGMSATGASTYRCLIESGYCCAVSVGDLLVTEPGNMSGPTGKGIRTRFARDSDGREGICYADYTGNGERVVMVPVTSRPSEGRSNVTVQSFSAFFLRDIPGNGGESVLTGEFLYDVVGGHSQADGSGDSGGTVYSIRLVR